MTSTDGIGRRALVTGAAALAGSAIAGPVHAFGEQGAFNPRILLTGKSRFGGRRATAPTRWAKELVRRTSAPARTTPTQVRADDPELLAEPFAIWSGGKAPQPLTRSEVAGLVRFLALGGVLFVDEQEPRKGQFTKAARRELGRVLPQGSPIAIDARHVVFRSFYLLEKATGRIAHAPKMRAVVRGGLTQVIYSPNDLLGALAREAGGVHPYEVTPGGEAQREMAIRLAVNVAMYALCSNYKDDQVHAPFLMRRRKQGR